MSTSVLFATFPPFPTLSLRVPSDTRVDGLHGLLCGRYPALPARDALHISAHTGPLSPGTRVSELRDGSSDLVVLRIVPRLRGGKGGFGSQLRAAGGRMSSQKTSNNDSCRDLSGRRLSTIKTAKRLVAHMENDEERRKAAAEAKKAKLDALEKRIASADPGSSAGTKHRLDDAEYLEESQDIIDNVRSAVATGLLKKKKKAKTPNAPSPSPSPAAPAPDSAGAERVAAAASG